MIEDYGDGWWRAYTQTSIGKVPANYFEVLSDENNQGEIGGEGETTHEGGDGYSYDYGAGVYDYNNGGGGDDQNQPAGSSDSLSASPSSSSTPTSPPSQQHPPISESPAYAEQMKCWGDILASQKEEKLKLEKQVILTWKEWKRREEK